MARTGLRPRSITDRVRAALSDTPVVAIVGIEMKTGHRVGHGAARCRERLRDDLGDRLVRGLVLHTGETAAPMAHRIWALPVHGSWTVGEDAHASVEPQRSASCRPPEGPTRADHESRPIAAGPSSAPRSVARK